MLKQEEMPTRKYRQPKNMDSDDLVAAFGLATRLRAREVAITLDMHLEDWLVEARLELESRKELEKVREFLPVYFDPSRKTPVFGPGAPLTTQATVEHALRQPPAKPVKAIAAT
jgi:hypothetical protein